MISGLRAAIWRGGGAPGCGHARSAPTAAPAAAHRIRTMAWPWAGPQRPDQAKHRPLRASRAPFWSVSSPMGPVRQRISL